MEPIQGLQQLWCDMQRLTSDSKLSASSGLWLMEAWKLLAAKLAEEVQAMDADELSGADAAVNEALLFAHSVLLHPLQLLGRLSATYQLVLVDGATAAAAANPPDQQHRSVTAADHVEPTPNQSSPAAGAGEETGLHTKAVLSSPSKSAASGVIHVVVAQLESWAAAWQKLVTAVDSVSSRKRAYNRSHVDVAVKRLMEALYLPVQTGQRAGANVGSVASSSAVLLHLSARALSAVSELVRFGLM